MGDTPEQQAAHDDVDHGFRDVEARLVIPHETAPFSHPAEGPLDDPAAGQDLEARLGIAAADDFQHEVLGQHRRRAVLCGRKHHRRTDA